MFANFPLSAIVASTLSFAIGIQALPQLHRLEARAVDLPTGWSDVGCIKDSSDRVLAGYMTSSSSMTPRLCANTCRGRGFSWSGTENGSQCFCSNSVVRRDVSTACSIACTGDKAQTCGGYWAMNLYMHSSAAPTTPAPVPPKSSTSTTVKPSTTTTSKPVTSATTSTSTSAKPTSTAPSANVITPKIASSSTEKKVWAHHMVGNTYPYTYDTWIGDINRAKSAGIDGFALNVGPDEWQPARVADAYRAAAALGFTMFLSFDMSVFNCVTTERLSYFQNYLTQYLVHSAAAKYNGKAVLSTFGGEWCTWGQGSGPGAVNKGWGIVMGRYRSNTYFMPAYTMGDGPRSLNQYDIDAEVNWGSAWPNSNTDLTRDNDDFWLSYLPNKYVATVAPSFFTHFGYKNWIHRSDDFLFSQRWEMLLSMRDKISQVEIVSWNDYGESHYINVVNGDQPPESKVWTMNPEIDHTPYLTLQAFYSAAWKNGALPAITQDKVWLTARPHSKAAMGTSDSVGRPAGWDMQDDEFYAQVHLKADASITVSTNSFTKTYAGKAGINRVAMALQVGSGIKIQVVRGTSTVIDLKPSFTFVDSPAKINHNYLIWQS